MARRISAPASAVLAAWCAVAVCLAAEGDQSSQLELVRSRIKNLQVQLHRIAAESADITAQQQRLNAELELAEARVREIELVLTESRDEAVRLRDEAAELAVELEARRAVLSRQLEMMTLLGRPGPLQLLFDAVQGGDLDQAVGTVSLLTVGQLRLMEEYEGLQRDRNARLATLSRVLEHAQREAAELVARRRELVAVRERVEGRLRQLQRSERRASHSLVDLREREKALGNLLEVLASHSRLTGREDVRRYRGALPWPAQGPIVRSFGRHFLSKYATYTVCNGLRLNVDNGSAVSAVFPGVVAYASHFKGYGNMVVVDHGNEVYSLVAGLASIHVRLDQSVNMGSPLGVTSPPAEDGNLYIEIRVDNQPEDPRRWLQLEEGQS